MKNKQEIKWRAILLNVIMSILFTISLYYVPKLEAVAVCKKLNVINSFLCQFSNTVKGFGIQQTLIAVLIFFTLNKCQIYSKMRPTAIINGLLIAMGTILGIIYTNTNTIRTIYASKYNFFMTIIMLVAFTYVISHIINVLYNWFDKLKIKENKPKSKILALFNNHPFIITTSLTLIISGIYLIILYPGTMAFDGLWQLNFYYDIWDMTNHHPVLVTMIMGKIMDFGHALLNDNFGMFLYLLLQNIINGITYGYVLLIMKKMDTPLSIRLISLIFYSCFPLLTFYSISYLKDTIFYLIFLAIFVAEYYHFWIKEKRGIIFYISLLILYIILFIYRQTGLYIAVFSLIILAIFSYTKKYKKDAIICLSFIIVMFGINTAYNLGLKHYDIPKAPIREMLSIPLQQTARYIKEYPNDLTDQERKYISAIFEVDISSLGHRYEAERSDAVKNKLLYNPNTKILKNYFKAWASMLVKHPMCYIDATLNNTYGYFYLGSYQYMNEGLGFFYIEDDPSPNKGNLDLHRNTKTKEIQDIIINFSKALIKVPLINLLYTPSLYVWILIICLLYTISKRKWQLCLIFIPLLLSVAICIISPVNTHIRYLLPVAVSIPFLLAIMIYEFKIKKDLFK